MSFAAEIVKDGRLVAFKADVSLDGWSTVAYRWSSTAGVDATNKYDPRILKIGRISRAFGNDNYVTTSDFEFVLDNSDGGLDSFCAFATATNQIKLRLKLYLYVCDPNNPGPSQSTSQTMQLGEYVVTTFSKRTNTTISFQLGDYIVDALTNSCQLPTMKDVYNALPSGANPLLHIQGGDWNAAEEMQMNGTWLQPLPVAFGNDAVPAILPTKYTADAAGDWDSNSLPVFFCATRSSALAGPNEALQLWVKVKQNLPMFGSGTWVQVNPGAGGGAYVTRGAWAASTAYNLGDVVTHGGNFYRCVGAGTSAGSGGPTGTSSFITDGGVTWAYDTAVGYQQYVTSFGAVSTRQIFQTFVDGTAAGHTITVDGLTWSVKWIALALDALAMFLTSYWTGPILALGQPGITVIQQFLTSLLGAGYSTDSALLNGFVDEVRVVGAPMSGITGAKTTGGWMHPADIIQDLITYYSKAGSSYVDTASFNRYRTAMPDLAASIILNDASSQYGKTMKQVVSEISGTFGCDFFTTWAGTCGVATLWRDFSAQTTAPLSISETRMSNVVETYASRETRWAPFNRIHTTGYKENFQQLELSAVSSTFFPPPSTGPFDDPNGSITTWGRVLPKTIQQGAMASLDQVQNPWDGGRGQPVMHPEMRPLMSFNTDISALQLEMGSLCSLTWTRGGSLPAYSGVSFQVESLAFDPERLGVSLSAVYQGDLLTPGSNQFILDDESITDRPSVGSSGRTATVQDSTATVSFSSGDLNADGVVAGDHLILMDTIHQTDNVFSRCRYLKIDAILSATLLRISDPDLNFGSPGGIALTQWQIRRSHLTYATGASDPSNYPSGSNMYGCVANSSGVFSAAGNRGFTAAQVLY